ncbi:SH3 domain-containing protein, partial [Clostridium sp.]|uniref:SH3 domain-containing protein n=1 Tax=Clostridium sp. TaxID=1506 RepID=UPI002A919F42
MKNLSKIVSIVAIVTSVVSTSAEAAMSIARLNSDQVLLTKATINKSEFGVTNTGNQNLNVRKSASTNSELLGKLPTGSKVEIVDKLANGWYRIKYKSSYGYVDSKYIDSKIPVSVTGVKLNKATLSLEKGKSETLKATISPSNASNKGVTWTSSNSKVATVDKNGKVK